MNFKFPQTQSSAILNLNKFFFIQTELVLIVEGSAAVGGLGFNDTGRRYYQFMISKINLRCLCLILSIELISIYIINF